jgi:hypothetical protein
MQICYGRFLLFKEVYSSILVHWTICLIFLDILIIVTAGNLTYQKDLGLKTRCRCA